MEEYYKLTEKEIKTITEYFEDNDLEELLDFIENGIGIVAGIHAVRYMENLVRKYGSHVLLNSCNNCAKSATICEGPYALNVCGEGLLEWEEGI